jgi:hypothetical protein
MTMGRADHPFSIVPDLQAKRGPRIMAVISPRFSWTLDALDDPRLAGLRVCEAMPGDPLEQIETDALDLLVLEVAPDEQASLDRLSHFHQQHGDVPVIAAIHDASLTLVRRLLHEAWSMWWACRWSMRSWPGRSHRRWRVRGAGARRRRNWRRWWR